MSNKTTVTIEGFEKMPCFNVMSVSFQYRCVLSREVPDCSLIMNLFKYFELMYCVMGIQTKAAEISLVLLYLLIVLALMVTISHVVDYYFAPMLKIIAIKFKMNEYLAGVTLLAFGNCFPDLVANMLPVRAEAPLYTITLSNSLAIILLSGGTVVYLKPFTMNGHSTLRDLLFLALSGEVLSCIVERGSRISRLEAILYSLLYIVFLGINIVDLILTRLAIKSLQSRIFKLMDEKPSIERKVELNKLHSQLRKLEVDDKMNLREEVDSIFHATRGRTSWRARLRPRASSDMSNMGFATHKPEQPLATVDFEHTRTILHSSGNPRNLFLFVEFFETIMPIDLEVWYISGFVRRCLLILKAPLVFICTLFIPVVDYHQDKHGWSKLLNCTQIITCPMMLVTVAHGILYNAYSGWIIELDFSYAMWTLCVTVPLAVIIFLTSRTDLPPPYHMVFLIMTAFSSMLIITICAAEMELLCSIIGLVLYLSEGFVAATLRSFAAAIADMLINTSLAMQGYEKMAFAAIIGGPIFNMILGVSIPCVFNENAHEEGAVFWLFGGVGTNCYIFYTLTVFSTLWWTLTFNFFARRSAAIFSFTLYLIFILFALLVEVEIIHEFDKDRVFVPL